jgi:nucleoside-diphosphate-sugar epimerase
MLDAFRCKIDEMEYFESNSYPIIFLGGGGFIGSTLFSLAQDLGFETLVVDSYPPINSTPVNFIQVDAFDKDFRETIETRLLPNSTLVILATPFIVDKANSDSVSSLVSDSDFFQKNVSRYYGGILDLIRNAGLKFHQIIYISSFDVYGAHHQLRESISEKTYPMPNSLYSITKLTGEIASCIAAKEMDCGLRILRLSQVIGKSENSRYQRLIPVLLDKFASGEHVSLKLAPNASRQYVSVYQVFAHLLDAIVKIGARNPIWNCVGTDTKIEELVNACHNIVGRGSFSIEYGDFPNQYRARVNGYASNFLNETFGAEYLNHIKGVILEEFEYLSKSGDRF